MTLQIGIGGTSGIYRRRHHRQRYAVVRPLGCRHLRRHDLRVRRCHPARRRHDDADGFQHLHRRDELRGGHAERRQRGGARQHRPLTFYTGTLQYSAANQTNYSSRFSTWAVQLYSIDTNGQAVTYASALTSPGGSPAKLVAGTLTLSGANTYSGATTINGGTLEVRNNNAVANTSQVVFTNRVGTAATLQVTSSETIGALSGGNASSAVTIASGQTITTGGALAYVQSASGTVAQAISGAGALTVSGLAAGATLRAQRHGGDRQQL